MPKGAWLQVRTALEAIGGAFFGREAEWIGRWSVVVVLVAQFFIGIFVWCSILNWGNPPVEMADWYDVTQPRLQFIQQAILQQQLPLHTETMTWAKGATDRFLSIPDQILSPQVLLLKWLSPGQFSLVQVLLMYSLGFWGLLRLRKRWGLSLAAFLPLAWLFSFNGHMVDHLAIGHLTWGGYFLLPFLVELVLDFVEGPDLVHGVRWAAKFALLQGVIFLQGSFHLFNLDLVLLILLMLFFYRQWKIFLGAIAASLLLCMVRILPAVIVANQLEIYFASGFTTLNELWRGLIELKPVAQALDSLTVVNPQVAWWEFDYFVGWVGLAWMVGFGVFFWLRRSQASPNKMRLLAVMGMLTVLSVGRVYNVIFILQIPLLSGERVTSRFFLLPLLIVAVLAAIGMQTWLDNNTGRVSTWLSIFAGLFILLASDLRQHYELWKVSELGSLFMPLTSPIPMKLANHGDPAYTSALVVGSVISAISLLVLAVILILTARRMKNRAAG